jgi:hypothetical protein
LIYIVPKIKGGDIFCRSAIFSVLCHVTRTATTASVVDISLLEYQEDKEQWLALDYQLATSLLNVKPIN